MARPGNPRNKDRVNTGVRFPRDLHDRLVAFAYDRDVPVNWVVNRAVEQYLARLEPLPPPPPQEAT